MEFQWENGFVISVAIQGPTVIVSANKEGLRSLANHLMALSEDDSQGAHFHLDEYNSLEENSAELIVERIDQQ